MAGETLSPGEQLRRACAKGNAVVVPPLIATVKVLGGLDLGDKARDRTSYHCLSIITFFSQFFS